MKPELPTDLVLEGGGVKGIALVGAVTRLVEDGYRFPRVGGTSAGAVVGAVLAALDRRGEPLDELGDIVSTLDLPRVRDHGFPGDKLGALGFLVDGLAGAFEGAGRGTTCTTGSAGSWPISVW